MDFDLDDPDAQLHFEAACEGLASDPFVAKLTCFLDAFKHFLAFNGVSFPVEQSSLAATSITEARALPPAPSTTTTTTKRRQHFPRGYDGGRMTQILVDQNC